MLNLVIFTDKKKLNRENLYISDCFPASMLLIIIFKKAISRKIIPCIVIENLRVKDLCKTL